ncbi:MAG: TIGR00269 family protein [Candidatus Woesearchaeota archaeon]|nr:TIGR00269 family protein [Candidatus Woesearchaeota archaeon]
MIKKIKVKNIEKTLEKKVLNTIHKYRLLNKRDKIFIACSGGKDSTSIALILKKYGYNIEAITVDVGVGEYTKQNLKNLTGFCRKNKIKLCVISLRKEFGMSLCCMRQKLLSKGIKLNSCTLCGILRRYLINKEARKFNADCVVTGHNLDDEAQAIMMNIFRNNLEVCARLGPRTGIKENIKFVPRVKPLYFCTEREIIKYSRSNGLKVIYAPCPFREDAYRNKIKRMLNNLEKNNRDIKLNIVKSFLSILPLLRNEYKDGEQEYCKECGEPCKRNICNTCNIIKKLK